jgi:D-alanyl-D-alanine carboxypeptidase/D-alanyl-D-alanine-endopeptidase (penicillin-binding protein 4)
MGIPHGAVRILMRLILLGLAVMGASRAQAQLPEPVARALAAVGIPAADVALLVQPLDADRPLVSHAPDRPFNPASVIKLLTTLAALDSLGPAYSFKTRVYTDGDLEGDTLHGNLIIKGGGDPSLTLERFWLLLRQVRARGIRHIEGDVLIDQSCYDLAPADPAVFDQAPLRPYNAPPAALLVDFNTLSLHITPDQGGLRLTLDPPGLPVRQALRLSDGPCDHWGAGLDYEVAQGALRVRGQYPASCGAQSLRLSLLPPDQAVAAAFVALWAELGGSLQGEVLAGHLPESARLLLEFDSLPLSRIVADINEHSNNVMARMLYLNLGAARYGAPATLAKGEAAMREWLKAQGLEMPELVLENGAGLSRVERISAASVAALLRLAARRPLLHDFAASLPALGLEGTLRKRLADTPMAGRAWLKTGSLNGARNLAGYVMDASGRRHILVFFVNHPRAAAATAAQDAAIEWVYKLPETDASGAR